MHGTGRVVRAGTWGAVLAGLAVLAGCGERTSGEPFVVGYVAPFAGDDGMYDRAGLDGARYEAARLNARDGIVGRSIELVTADVSGDPAAAAAAARRLVAEGAGALLAPPYPEYAHGVVEVGAEAGVPVLSVAGTIPSIVGDAPGAFLTAFGDNVQAAAAAEVAVDRGHRTALLVSTSDLVDYGDALPRYFEQAFVDRGGSIVATVEVDLDDADPWSPVSAALRDLDAAPDLVYTAVYPPWLGDLLTALRVTGYTGPVFAADGAETPDLIAAGAIAEGTVITSHAFTASHPTVGVLFSPRSPAERLAEFAEGYARFHGEAPETLSFAALGADAIGILHTAAHDAGTTDGAAMIDAIGRLDRAQITTGRITYRDRGTVPVKVVYVLEVRDGAFELVRAVEPERVPAPLP